MLHRNLKDKRSRKQKNKKKYLESSARCGKDSFGMAGASKVLQQFLTTQVEHGAGKALKMELVGKKTSLFHLIVTRGLMNALVVFQTGLALESFVAVWTV